MQKKVLVGLALAGMTVQRVEHPSSLEPSQVVPAFNADGYDGECSFTATERTTGICFIGRQYTERQLGKGFVKGYIRDYAIYNLKTGQGVGVYHPALRLLILKYQSPAIAQQSYVSPTASSSSVTIDSIDVQQSSVDKIFYYSVRSNEFIVIVESLSDAAARDTIDRIISAYKRK